MDSTQAVGLTLTAVGTSLGLFGQVLPPPHTLAGKDPSSANVDAVHTKASQAALAVLAIGGGASMLARSPWPLVGAGGVCAWLWWQYDLAAKAPAGALV